MKHAHYLKTGISSWETIHWTRLCCIVTMILGSSLFFFHSLDCNSADDKNSNEKMLAQYIQSKGTGIIVFDASNIKQFWIDHSVMSKNKTIEIALKEGKTYESVPLRIQLANVIEAQDCRIEVVSETEGLEFSVLNSKLKELSTSQKEENFIDYSVSSATLHLEDLQNMVFFLKFKTNTSRPLLIKKIILSFSNNKNSSFLASPGTLKVSPDNIRVTDGKATVEIITEDNNSFSLTGKRLFVSSTKKIYAVDNIISASFKIKNIGNTATAVSLAFGCYAKNGEKINGRNFPYKNINKVLTVIHAEAEESSIVVDGYSDWTKGCYLALDVQDDMSDIPCFSLADGTINEVRKLDDGRAEIILSSPLKSSIKEGTKVRIHGRDGAYLYPMSKTINGGEEEDFSGSIKKDEMFLQYSATALSRGVYYVVPMLLSYSIDPQEDNSILVENYSISF